MSRSAAYTRAQLAIAELKASVHELLELGMEPTVNGRALTNAQIGRALGIYQGHEGHEGHIPRSILALMEADGTVKQDEDTKLWRLRGDSNLPS